MRVKYVVQEHNTMSPARARTRTAHSRVKYTNHEATTPVTQLSIREDIKFQQEKNTSMAVVAHGIIDETSNAVPLNGFFWENILF